jgi:hypothetical protein
MANSVMNEERQIESWNELVSGNDNPSFIERFKFQSPNSKAKAAITRNITRRFKNAKYRNTDGGLKEYSKAYALVKMAIDPSMLRNPELMFGNQTFGKIITLLIVKEWQQAKLLHPYKDLVLSATSKCTKNWIERSIGIFMAQKRNYETSTEDKNYFDMLVNYSKTSSMNASHLHNILDKIPDASVVKFLHNKFGSIASILAFGFIDMNNQWFNYNTEGRAIGAIGEGPGRMKDLGCTIEDLDGFYTEEPRTQYFKLTDFTSGTTRKRKQRRERK